MLSKWSHLKEDALEMRRSGMSMTTIERKLGIARSTLSGWFKGVELTNQQKVRLNASKADGWAKARIKAAESHRAQKALRLLKARQDALRSLDSITLDGPVLDLAFAMLYWGEGAKNGSTSLASSDPKILKFVLAVLKLNYGITPDMVRCELHLRLDQPKDDLVTYWSKELTIPVSCFKNVMYDKRSEGKPTYDHYKGVCVVNCRNIAIQRKLIYLYSLFCDKVTDMGT